jgi:tricorn protease-like protein
MQSSQDAEFPVFVLWDMVENQALWTLDKNSVYFVLPVWSPDLSKLAVVAMNQKEDNWDRFELLLVDVNGYATQWIDLKRIYPDVLITDMKWSPDSRYLAFLAPDNKPFLILDTSTQQLLDYCIPGNSSYGKIV